MKNSIRFISLLTAAALFAAGCVNEDPAYRDGGSPVAPGEDTGYLALGRMQVHVLTDDSTETLPDHTGDDAPRPRNLPTRTEPDTDGFIVELTDAGNRPVESMTYGELRAMEEPLTLPAGVYRLSVRSERSIPDAAWEHPAYGAEREVTIVKGETTELDEIVCTLQNIKVTLMCSADLADMLSSDTRSTISLGGTSMVFGKDERRAAYFRAAEEENTLDFVLEGKFADTGDEVKFSRKIEKVKAGQWRKITLVIEWADKGDAKLDITVDSFVQDDEVTVNGTEGLWEEVLPDDPAVDPSAPSVEWPGHDLSKPFRLTGDMFDESGSCTVPFEMSIASPNGISSLTVDVGSDNAEFLSSLETVLQLDGTSFDLCALTPEQPAYTILQGFGFPLGDRVKGQRAVRFDLAGQMPLLYAFEGTHTFRFVVADANSLTAQATLTLVVDKQAAGEGPLIEWEGYDIGKVYSLKEVSSIKIDVKAPAGIRSFIVEIDSAMLVDMIRELGFKELTEPFDLCTLSGEAAEFLADVGFKTGSEVTGQTQLAFDITGFIEILKTIGDASYNFRFEVTDNDGRITKGAVQLKQ